MKAQSLKLETMIRERDQWKKIAEARSGAVSPAKSLLSRPVTPADDLRVSEYEKLYKDVQSEFDIYRKESNTNLKLLKDEIASLNQEKIDLTIQSARLNTQVNYQVGT
jgi:hypothetical protein